MGLEHAGLDEASAVHPALANDLAALAGRAESSAPPLTPRCGTGTMFRMMPVYPPVYPHATRSSRRAALLLLAAAAFALLGGAGCENAETGASRAACDRQSGMYLDFESGACRQPSGSDDALRLNTYARLSTEAQRSPDDLSYYRVSLKRYLTPDETQAFLTTEPRPKAVRRIFLYYPDNPGSSLGLLTGNDLSELSAPDTALKRATGEVQSRYGDNPTWSEKTARYAAEKLYIVRGFDIQLRHSDAPSYWQAHQDVIRLLDPIGEVLIRPLYGPEEDLQ